MTTIERLDPTDDAQFAAYYEAYRAAHDREWDRPYSATEKRVGLLESGVYQDSIGVIARDGFGHAVGIGLAEVPLKDNLLTGFVGLRVLPAHRRRGYGSALLEALLDVCRLAGRQKVMGVTQWTPGESNVPGRAFADSHGFVLDQVDAHRVLDLPASLPAMPARDGYVLHSWRGPCPERWIDDYATLRSLLTQEAPSGDLALEAEFFDAERIKIEEASLEKQGRIMVAAVALDATGRPVGHTQLVFPESDPLDVYQWDTLVLSAHRGHGLGLSLKVHVMDSARDLLEGRTMIHTYNAVSNSPMIAVNEAMGFRLVAYAGEFIRDV